MPDDVGGISVSFIAEASQLKSEIDRLEQRLKTFNRAHGQQQVKLNAALNAPTDREMGSFRRKIQNSVNGVGASGDAVGIKARVMLEAPTSAQIAAVRRQIQGLLNATPLTVKVTPIVEGGSLGGGGTGGAGGGGGGLSVALPTGTTKTGKQVADRRAEQRSAEAASKRTAESPSVTLPTPTTTAGSTAAAISSGVTSGQKKAAPPRRAGMTVTKQDLAAKWEPEDVQPFSRAELQQYLRRKRPSREDPPREMVEAELIRRDAHGIRGFDDPYASSLLRERRQSMRQANAIRLASARPLVDFDRLGAQAMRRGPGTPEEQQQRISALDAALGRTRPTGGGPRGFTETGLSHWAATGAQVPAAQTVAAMARRGQLTMPARDLYDPHVPGRERDLASHLRATGGLTRAGQQQILFDQKTGERVKNPSIGVETLPHLKTAVLERNLERVLQRASPEAIAAGKGWYTRAGALAEQMGKGTGLGRQQVLAATSTFSTQASWGENVRNVQDFFEAIRRGATTLDEVNAEVGRIRKGTGQGGLGLNKRTERALRVAFAPDEAAIESEFKTAPKLNAFRKALGGDTDSFTVDRHMALMMAGAPVAGDQRVHTPFQRAGQNVARRHGMTPADLQAITWVAALGHEIAGADPYQMQARTTPTAQRVAMETSGARGFFSPTPRSLMVSPGDQIDPVTGAPTRSAIERYGEMGERELTSSESMQRRATQWRNRQLARMPSQMHARVQEPWGGFTVDPRTGEFIEPEAGRTQGPWISGVGETERISARAARNPAQVAAAIERLRQNPINAQLLAQGGVIGGFNSPDRGEVDFDVSMVDQTAAAAYRRQVARGPEGRGAYNVATGNGLFGPENVYGEPATRVPGMGQGRWADTRRFASAADLAAGRRFRVAQPPVGAVGFDVPAYQRGYGSMNQGAGGGGGGGQPPAPPSGPPGDDEESLQELLDTGGRQARRAQVDVVGQPAMSPELRDRYAGPASQRARDIMTFAGEGKIAIQEARGAGQQRAVGTTVASQLATVLGRGVDVAKINEMTSILGQMVKVANDGDDAFARMEKARDDFGAGSDPFKAAAAEAKSYDDQLNKLRGRFEALQPNKVKQMAIGMGSAIGGTIIGLTLFQGATTAVQMFGEALKDPLDRLMGFRMTAERLAPALGQSVRQLNGFTEGAVSAQFAQTGMGQAASRQIRPLIEQRAAIEGGNAAFKEQLELIRASTYYQNNPQAGITQATGGLLGTPIGATQPFFEQLLQSGSPVGGPLDNPLLQSAAKGAFWGTAIGASVGSIAPGAGTAVGAVVGGIGGGIAGLVGGLLGGAGDPFAQRYAGGNLSDEDIDRLNEFRVAVESSNEAAKRASPNIAATAQAISYLDDSSQKASEAVEATARYFEQQGQQAQADAAREMRFAIVDPRTGQATDPSRFARAALQGATMPDREMLAGQMARQWHAQLQRTQWQGEFTRDTAIPARTFMSQIASGRFEASGQQRAGLQDVVSPAQAAQFGGNLSGLNSASAQLAGNVSAGATAMQDLMTQADRIARVAGPSNLAQGFREASEAAAATSAQMRDISVRGQRMQFGLQLRQIAEQQRVAGQALADAQSFISGRPSAGPGGGALGVLQAEARQLDIRSAELGFAATEIGLARNQAQINAQRAIAGFAAPGATGEERAARMRYAEEEARRAQQLQDINVSQLGVSREQFTNQQEQITVSAARAVETLNNQISILNESAAVTVQLQIDATTLERLSAVRDEQLADLQSYVDEATQIVQGQADQRASLVAATGGYMAEMDRVLLTAFRDHLDNLEDELDGRFGGRRSGTRARSGAGNLRYQAPGFFGNVSGATQMTVGEAGPETIAILRNPRTMTFPAGGGGAGGVNVNITITGNNIGGSEQDTEAFAAAIARKVEETMSRRGALTGLRGPN